MDLSQVVSRDEWLAARKELLKAEKETMLAQDAVSAQRRQLPMVKIDKEYTFAGPEGEVRLLDLFEGRDQLIIYHFMFGPDDHEGHNSCSLLVDNISHPEHLHANNTTVALVSRAPIAKLTPFRTRMGWTIPWYSSFGSDFNYDFHVTNDESVAPVEYNYKDKDTLIAKGTPWYTSGEWQGLTVFVRDGDAVYHHVLHLRAWPRPARQHLQLPGSDAVGTAVARHPIRPARHLQLMIPEGGHRA